MHQGDKAVLPPAFTLPPLSFAGRRADLHVILPPISSYKLTENNLSSLSASTGSYTHVHAPKLGSVSSLVNASNHLLQAAAVKPLTPPSLALSISLAPSSEASVSPASSPTMGAASLDPALLATKRRRQRLGPSCDLCRSRKVKCNADIVVLSKYSGPEDVAVYSLTAQNLDDLAAGQPVLVDPEYYLIVANTKLIKFKACESCCLKGLPCCFSKGFTKEDIMLNKKVGGAGAALVAAPKRRLETSPVPAPGKITKKRPASPVASRPVLPDAHATNLRKSSCVSCRKRKVKCVFNQELNKCDGCAKKDHTCTF